MGGVREAKTKIWNKICTRGEEEGRRRRKVEKEKSGTRSKEKGREKMGLV